jgi:uncharacterized protein YegJ (DUF2314 family)
MAKFGMPDLVIQNFGWSFQRNVVHLINLCAQAMAEGQSVGNGGEMTLRLASIRNAAVRDPQLAALGGKAKAEVALSLRQGTREEGDPDNRLIEIRFDRHPGADVHSRLEGSLTDLFGAEDSSAEFQHDTELLASSEHARERLPELHRVFDAGLPPGAYLLVKAPFPTTSGGKEWMWVEVARWRRKTLTGLLANDPSDVPALNAGQKVDVREDDVFDYILHHVHGKEEGNETGTILASRLAQKTPARKN